MKPRYSALQRKQIARQMRNIHMYLYRLEYLVENILGETLRTPAEEHDMLIPNHQKILLSLHQHQANTENFANVARRNAPHQYLKGIFRSMEGLPALLKQIAKLSKAMNHPMHFEILRIVSRIQQQSILLERIQL